MLKTEEQSMKAPLTRPMFTEDHPGEVRVKEPEHTCPLGKLKKNLDRLKSLSAKPGKRQLE